MKKLTITKDDGYYALKDETGFTGFLSFYEGEGGISGLALESESYCVTLIKTKGSPERLIVFFEEVSMPPLSFFYLYL